MWETYDGGKQAGMEEARVQVEMGGMEEGRQAGMEEGKRL